MKHSICIIALSPIYRDGRVLRQIKYLSPHYDLIVLGYGHPHPAWQDKPNIRWITLDRHSSTAPPRPSLLNRLVEKIPQKTRDKVPETIKSMIFGPINFFSRSYFTILGITKRFITFISLLIIGRLFPIVYERWYWRNYQWVFEQALSIQCDAYHANDWETLPLAVEAAKKNKALVVSDLHEYAPRQYDNYDNKKYWKWTISPMIVYFLKKCTPFVSGLITASTEDTQAYKQEHNLDFIQKFGSNFMVILNAPELEDIPYKELISDDIRLIHHGGAARMRRLEAMIETIALCDKRYSLHLMLVASDDGYIEELKNLAEKLAPNRVIFEEPVTPEKITQKVADYDIGFCFIAPTNFQYRMTLPNKFFDFIVGGLAICIGPSPAMVEIVKKHECGCVAPSFEPQDIADMLNRLTLNDIETMRQASREAAKQFNAEKELGKVVELYKRLLK